MIKNIGMIYAIQNNKIKHISEVVSGKKCNCVCSYCSEKLIAKKGSKMMQHFAHVNEETCKYGYETSLHLGAKDIMTKIPSIKLPDLYLKFPKLSRKKLTLQKVECANVLGVEIEKRTKDIIPDLIVHTDKGDILIEIYVTHAVDDIKLNKIMKENLAVLEIDLSNVPQVLSQEELIKIFTEDHPSKKWLYHPLIKETYDALKDNSNTLYIKDRGFATHVDYCPINSRITKYEKSYARLEEDCKCCIFCLDINRDNKKILCSGKTRISSLLDMHLSQDDRNKKYRKLYKKDINEFLSDMTCPQCYDHIDFKRGSKGYFIRCDSFPYCKFTWGTVYDDETGEVSIKLSKSYNGVA